jgi:hypothetical protein
MINSGQDNTSNETGGWTSFAQGEDVCNGGTNANEVRGLVCGDGNPGPLEIETDMATNGGEIQSAFNKLYDCWSKYKNDGEPWEMTLPLIECPGNNVGPCQKMVGTVNVFVVWITGAGEDPGYNDAPTNMGGWSSTDPVGQNRWDSFVDWFQLQNVDGSQAPYKKKSIYFKPGCDVATPRGGIGGVGSNVLSEHFALVE